MSRGQLSIEFILLMVMSFALLFTFAFAIMSVSTQKNEQRTFHEMNSLGLSLQNEFLLSSELEDGYVREIQVPLTMNGLDYTITNGDSVSSEGYLEINFGNLGLTYNIPIINGTIHKGNNILKKKDGWLILN